MMMIIRTFVLGVIVILAFLLLMYNYEKYISPPTQEEYTPTHEVYKGRTYYVLRS